MNDFSYVNVSGLRLIRGYYKPKTGASKAKQISESP